MISTNDADEGELVRIINHLYLDPDEGIDEDVTVEEPRCTQSTSDLLRLLTLVLNLWSGSEVYGRLERNYTQLNAIW